MNQPSENQSQAMSFLTISFFKKVLELKSKYINADVLCLECGHEVTRLKHHTEKDGVPEHAWCYRCAWDWQARTWQIAEDAVLPLLTHEWQRPWEIVATLTRKRYNWPEQLTPEQEQHLMMDRLLKDKVRNILNALCRQGIARYHIKSEGSRYQKNFYCLKNDTPTGSGSGVEQGRKFYR